MPSFTFVSTANAVRAARRDAGLRRRPRGHAEPRRDAGRGRDHRPHEGDRARALRRRRLRDGRAGRARRARTAWLVIEDAAQGIMASWTAAGRSAAFGALGSAQLPRDEERHLRRGRRAARQRRRARRARRDPAGEGHRPAAASSAARSTSTPGSTSAPRTCRARSTPPSSGRSSSRPTRSPPRGSRIWAAYHEAFEPSSRSTGSCAGRSFRTLHPQRAHVLPPAAPTSRRATAFIARLAEGGVHGVFHYVPLHASLAGGRYSRAGSALTRTDEVSDRLVRLPLWIGMGEQELECVIEAVFGALSSGRQI